MPRKSPHATVTVQRVTCPVCDEFFLRPVGASGRPREYCSDECRTFRNAMNAFGRACEGLRGNLTENQRIAYKRDALRMAYVITGGR